MAVSMNPEPEYTRHERFLQYAEALQERFVEGYLAELQDLPQWVVLRAEIEDGRPKKVPYNPNYEHLQARASVKIPKSWGTLADALLTLQSGHYSGIGFVITPPLVMIDLDHSVERTAGAITDLQAQEIVEALNSYTELSPSGTGLHILSYGQLPGKGIHTAIEMYGQERFTHQKRNMMQCCNGFCPAIFQGIHHHPMQILSWCSSCSTGRGTMWN